MHEEAKELVYLHLGLHRAGISEEEWYETITKAKVWLDNEMGIFIRKT